jgi:hypothetical protein
MDAAGAVPPVVKNSSASFGTYISYGQTSGLAARATSGKLRFCLCGIEGARNRAAGGVCGIDSTGRHQQDNVLDYTNHTDSTSVARCYSTQEKH